VMAENLFVELGNLKVIRKSLKIRGSVFLPNNINNFYFSFR